MTLLNPLPCFGKRTQLRRFAATDLAAFQSYRQDAEVGKYQGWTAQPDAEAAKFILEMQSAALFSPGQWLQLAISELDSNVLIGDIGVCLAADQSHAEIGFSMSPSAQGRGLAADAVSSVIALIFETTEATQIIGVTDARNLASIKLLERVGMVCTASAEAIFRGEVCVEHTYMIDRAQSQRPTNR